MAEIASAFVSILPSMKGFQSKVTREASAGLTNAGRAMGKAMMAGAAIGIASGAAFLKGAVSEAANLEQSVGAIDTVFKKSAGQMHDWAKNAATQVGLTRNEFNELGTLIGTQLKNGGTAMDALAPKTNELITLGADLASMFGGTTRDAVAALSSALKGERDPIEAFGVSLNQAKIDAEAAALGFEKVGGSLSSEANQAATLSLIMKQTADAHGNFARESDTLAHKQQVLTARFKDMQARVGTALLPVIVRFLDVMEKHVGPALVKVRKAVEPVVRELAEKLAPAVEEVTDFFKEHPEVLKGAAIGLGILAAALGVVALAMGAVALATSPITLTIVAVAALGAAIGYLYTNSESFRLLVDQLWAALKQFGGWLGTVMPPILTVVGEAFGVLWSALRAGGEWVLSTLIPALVKLGSQVAENLSPIFTALGELFRDDLLPVLKQVAEKFREWWPTIQKVIEVVAKMVGGLIVAYTWIAGKVIPVVIKVAGIIISTYVPAILKAIGVIASIIEKIASFVSSMITAGKAAIDFAAKVGTAVGDVIQFFVELPGRILATVGHFGRLLFDAGYALMKGLADGIRWGMSLPIEAISTVASIMSGGFPHSPVKWGALRSFNGGKNGRLLMGMLTDGIKSGEADAVGAVESVAAAMSRASAKQTALSFPAARIRGALGEINTTATGLGHQERVAAAHHGQLLDRLRAIEEIQKRHEKTGPERTGRAAGASATKAIGGRVNAGRAGR